MLWVLLFAAIAVGGLVVLGCVVLRLWLSARRLLAELDVMAARAAELADLLTRVGVATGSDGGAQTGSGPGSELTSDDAWPGTVETYDDGGASAPGKKES